MISLSDEAPLIIAHRGFSSRFPENTLAAFKAALDANADMIELDVCLTRDRHVVVIHDDTLERTTGEKGRVDQADLAGIRGLDAGGWFHPQFYSEPIPTLEEVFDLVGGRVPINIEVKSSAFEDEQPADAIELQVVDMVQAYSLADSVLISSFEWRLPERVSRIEGAPEVALLSEDPLSEDALDVCKNLVAYSWHQDQKTLTPEQVSAAHDAGLRVFAYTVNSQQRFRRLVDMGVDGVFTDNPMGLMARFWNPDRS